MFMKPQSFVLKETADFTKESPYCTLDINPRTRTCPNALRFREFLGSSLRYRESFNRSAKRQENEQIISEKRLDDLLVEETYQCEVQGQVQVKKRKRFDPDDEYEKKDVVKFNMMVLYDKIKTSFPNFSDYNMLFDTLFEEWWSSTEPTPFTMNDKEREKSFKCFIKEKFIQERFAQESPKPATPIDIIIDDPDDDSEQGISLM